MVLFCCLAGSSDGGSEQEFSVENPLLAGTQNNNSDDLFSPPTALLNPKEKRCLRAKLFIHAVTYGGAYVALGSVWYLFIVTGFDLSKWDSEQVSPYTIPIMAAASLLVATVMFYFEWYRLAHSLDLVTKYLTIHEANSSYLSALRKKNTPEITATKGTLISEIIDLAKLSKQRKSTRKRCIEPLHLFKFIPYYVIQTFTLNIMLKCFLVMMYDDSIVDGGVDPGRLFSTGFDKASIIGCGLTAAVYGPIRADDNNYTLSDKEIVSRVKAALTLFERSSEGALNNCEAVKSDADDATERSDVDDTRLINEIYKMKW